MKPKALTVEKVAEMLDVSVDHVKKLARKEILIGFRTSGKSGDWRFRPEAVEQFMKRKPKKRKQNKKASK